MTAQGRLPVGHLVLLLPGALGLLAGLDAALVLGLPATRPTGGDRLVGAR